MTRFHRTKPNVYVVSGYFQGNSIAGSKMTAFADQTPLPLETLVREGLMIRKRYAALGIGFEDIDREYDMLIELPENPDFRWLRLYQEQEGKKTCVYRISGRMLKKLQKQPDWYLETWQETETEVKIGGWAVGNGQCRLQLLDGRRRKIPSRTRWYYRQDIVDQYPELAQDPSGKDDVEQLSFGFEIAFDKNGQDKILLIAASEEGKAECSMSLRRKEKNIRRGGQPLWKKARAYFRRNGFRAGMRRILQKLSGGRAGHSDGYMAWRRNHLPGREELEAQRRNRFLHEPLISVAVPLYKTPHRYLEALIKSMQAQTYGNWQLCFSDGSGEQTDLTALLEGAKRLDPRICFVTADQPMRISENTNLALTLAQGEYIAFADHDDLLAPDALYEFVKCINENPGVQLLYSDEDKVSMNGKEFFQPHFKTDFNIDLLTSMNYICHLVMVHRDLLEKVGGLRSEYDGAQDYDFVLRCAEQTDQIRHIPKALYHWRSHQDSTAENPESKRYAFEAGTRAVQAHFDRTGIAARVEEGAYPGLYRVIYEIPEDAPLVSVIIPNKDHTADLELCLRSILDRTTYPNIEIIIVENNSTEEETFTFYKRMEQQYECVRTVYWEEEFNFSKINNFGVEHAKGEYLLFLNNDTEMLTPDCLSELVGPCLRPDVGAVGARLFYPDHTIQHAGVIIGYGGIAGHAFVGMDGSENGYFSRIICQSDLSAVTAACMLVKREAFEQAGGFLPELQVAFNDIDLCLKMREAGWLIVYNPFAQLTHYESKSRGYEDTPEKIARFNKEADVFLKRWYQYLKDGDPYYNPNLSLNRADFALK